MTIEKLIISKSQIESFKKLSSDLNPLHGDVGYASRTNFGHPVAYGISSLLFSISKWATGKSVSITKAKIFFKKPIFIDQVYELCVDDNLEGKVVLEIRKGPTSFSKFNIEYCNNLESKQQNLSIDIQKENDVSRYDILADDLQNFYKCFHLKEGQIPASQIIFLCWTSYYVGMINPGKQALYTQLSFTVAGSGFNKIEIKNEEFHPIFQTTTINAEAIGFSKDIVIKALNRPMNIEYPISQIKNLFKDFSDLKDKTVLITGANRGFGAVLAKICALSGASIIAIYRTNSDQMKTVEDEVCSCGGTIKSFQVDLNLQLSVQAILDIFHENNFHVDFVINNAAPVIYPVQFQEFVEDEFQKEFLKFFQIGLNTILFSTKVLDKGGTFVNISTSFLDSPVQEFSHYISAKSAIEGLINSVAIEYPNIKFFNYRLPKILTDQTNIAFKKDHPEDPVKKAIELLSDLVSRIKLENRNNATIKLY